jgi:hypothetical protein
VQQRRLHKENQPLEQLERVIEEIRELMVRSEEKVASRRNMNMREPSIAVGKKKREQ